MEPNKYEIHAYKIWWDGKDGVYVGSTKGKLSRRMGDHRAKCRKGRPYKLYKVMAENGINDFQYILLGSRIVERKDQQLQFEQEWIDKIKPNLNLQRAYCTEEDNKNTLKKYREINKEKIAAHNKIYGAKYLKDNREKIKTKNRKWYADNQRQCHCGGTYNRALKRAGLRHFKTKKHLKFKIAIASNN